jgi:nucleoside-diphosphate-sugar epimerase
MECMNILLVGGSGFLSGTLARTAVAAGHQVTVVSRGQKSLPEGVSSIVTDRHDAAGFQSAIENATTAPWDLVVDCIGYEVADAQQDIAVFRDRAKHLVFISTDFVYDPPRRQFPQDEEKAFYLENESYGAKKRRCELEFINSDCGDMAWTVLRPGHIYGAGSRLGCLPVHGRDPQLIERLRNGETLKLVGGGHFLQQPIYAPDLAEMILSCGGNRQANRQIYNAAGPDIIESHTYYRIIADELGVGLDIEELPVAQYKEEHPEHLSFLCHRIVSMEKAKSHGLALPATTMAQGLKAHVASVLGK